MFSIKKCNLCPHRCGVDRTVNKGACGVIGEDVKVARAALHMWEEPCISGENGSGTIFFSGCNLKCVYCQNAVLSHSCDGKNVTISQLSDAMISLQQQGAHNINLVTPTHYWLQIKQAIFLAREKGLCLPIVYNTSGYESVEAIESLSDIVSIYLTDYKYADNSLGKEFSAVSDYDQVAWNALNEMVKQVGSPVFDESGILERGVIVRHLVLPSFIANSKEVLNKVYHAFGDDVIFSIMNQYTPIGKQKCSALNRRLTESEYDDIINYALSIGIKNAYIQDGETQKESFIPEFNGEGF